MQRSPVISSRRSGRSLVLGRSLVFMAWMLGVALTAGHASAAIVDPPACQTVRLSDVGWTDITATTAVTARILEGLGYRAVTQILSIPVTYASMRNRQIDVYLGDWQPSLQEDRKPFLADGSVQVVRANLEGAEYTLAVPTYVAQAGVTSFADLKAHAGQFQRKIFGIEAGNDGNHIIATMIAEDRFGLGDWNLVESSEQGMLSEVARAERNSDWIVFLGWSPHPMNLKYRMQFLTGGGAVHFGEATIYTDVRSGYLEECPNVGKFLRALAFTPELESQMMALILDDHLEGPTAATAFLRTHADRLDTWLQDVVTRGGEPGVQAVRRSLAASQLNRIADRMATANAWVVDHKIPVGRWLDSGVRFALNHAQGAFNVVSNSLGWAINLLTKGLMQIPPLPLIAGLAIAVYALHRSRGLACFVLGSLLLIDNLGYWAATIQTLSLVLFSTLVCMVCGVPIGIAAAHRPWLYRVLHPLLDLMQTIPTFVYLIPTLVLFGLGVVPGLISTVIFAIPAPIRLTHLGISSVPPQLREVAQAFGATRAQLLLKVELPHALPTIMAGVTQCIMLSLSMVVIAALVGADGLGKPVVRALNSVNIAMGFEAGLAIVVVAIILDRIFKQARRKH
jgi:glycine betaine/proline transport system substrate-binding protein